MPNRLPRILLTVAGIILLFAVGAYLDWWVVTVPQQYARSIIGFDYHEQMTWVMSLSPLLMAAGGLAVIKWGLPVLPRWALSLLLAIGVILCLRIRIYEAIRRYTTASPILDWLEGQIIPGNLVMLGALLVVGSGYYLWHAATLPERSNPQSQP